VALKNYCLLFGKIYWYVPSTICRNIYDCKRSKIIFFRCINISVSLTHTLYIYLPISFFFVQDVRGFIIFKLHKALNIIHSLRSIYLGHIKQQTHTNIFTHTYKSSVSTHKYAMGQREKMPLKIAVILFHQLYDAQKYISMLRFTISNMAYIHIHTHTYTHPNRQAVLYSLLLSS